MSNRSQTVLIIDDDRNFHLAVKQSLKGFFECRSAHDTEEAAVILRKSPIDIALLDVQMRTDDEGLRAIPVLREIDPDLAIVMSSGRTDFETVREAMRLGAVDYVAKDFAPEDLRHVLDRVHERKTLIQRRDQQNFELSSQQKRHLMIGESAAIVALRRMIERVRQSQASVVITGETGTGKEVVARQLRRALPDGTYAPFVAIDSSTIQSTTAESLLFGHEKGAFTGADRLTKGVFEEADGGIVYFDEIGNMPLDIQAKLLRVLQEREFTRLGSSKPIQSNFRVVCATNRGLEQMVRDGQFKDDLLQRLNVLPLELPPLRERASDVPLLVEHFLDRQREERPRLRFTDGALAALQAYSWPGNIRELSNVVAYVATMTEGTEVEVADLPPRIRDSRGITTDPSDKSGSRVSGSFYERVAEFERELLSAEYLRNEKNVSRMALALGMDRSHLYTKLKEHGIHAVKR